MKKIEWVDYYVDENGESDDHGLHIESAAYVCNEHIGSVLLNDDKKWESLLLFHSFSSCIVDTPEQAKSNIEKQFFNWIAEIMS